MRLLQKIYTHRWDALLAPAILLEAGFLFCFYNEGNLYITYNEIGFALSSVAVGLLLMLRYWKKEVMYAVSQPSVPILSWLSFALLLVGIAGFCDTCRDIFNSMLIMPEHSDIVPTIQIAVRRFLNGENVYSTVQFKGWSFPMTYLPMTWLPYTMAEPGHFDYRWISVGIICVASVVVVARCGLVSGWNALLTTALLLVTGRILLQKDPGIIGMSVELMVAGYYMLLITGIGGRSPWLRGIFIALCLLSRFSLILWLPLWAVTEFLLHRRNALKAYAAVAIPVLCLYIIPYLSRDWSYFYDTVHAYSSSALVRWQEYMRGANADLFKHGVGFARIFCDKLYTYSVGDRLRTFQKAQQLLCIGIPVVMGLWYWLVARHKLHPRIFLFASFKIYLTAFLCFIQVPFMYLMITSIVVSIAIFAELGRYRVVTSGLSRLAKKDTRHI